MTRIVFLLFLLIIETVTVFAKEYSLSEWGFYLDTPEGWLPLEVTEQEATFSDSSSNGFFKIRTYPNQHFSTPQEGLQAVADTLNAQAEGELFIYNNRQAFFAALSFQKDSFDFQGYGCFIDGENQDVLLLSFASQDQFSNQALFLLSIMDSFALDDQAYYFPGPVSQFYYPLPSPNKPGTGKEKIELSYQGKGFSFYLDKGEAEAAKVAIDREARLLMTYTARKPMIEAWKRYYRIIYRDNFHRLDDFITGLNNANFGRNQGAYQLAVSLLEWLQDFTYKRSGGVSDLLSPLAVLQSHTGDCDSLGLVYCILLKHFDIHALLLVSLRYNHAIVAVDVAGKGAKYLYQGKQYLVAELTDRVGIGLIPSQMADPAGWIPVEF